MLLQTDVMTHSIRKTFEDIFNKDSESLGMDILYDVCHNICKYEEHEINGENRNLYVHRKGATRAFPPGHSDVPKIYRDVGQPVLIAGSMGTASYVLTGTEQAMSETFGSTCHKEGRFVVATHPKVIAEEAPGAYKDVDEVIESVHGAGISTKVARMVPLAVAKG
jgi:tRNA-splicing ligase RtcB